MYMWTQNVYLICECIQSLSAEDDVRVHCSKESGEVVREDVEGEGDAGKGFGGIKMASVHEIIAKARFNESYLHVNLGLSESLDDLSRHFENEGNGAVA